MKRAVVLAGGQGTRLRPYTAVLPKPLMPVGDRPVLDIVVRQLKRDGFEKITIATGYLAELIARHTASGAAATIATTTREVQISLGVLHFEENGSQESHKLTGYTEKPKIEYQASMGVYCFSPRAVNFIESGERLDFPDLILRLIAAGEEVRGWMSSDYWLDIGRHDDYEQAQAEFERMRDRLIPHE